MDRKLFMQQLTVASGSLLAIPFISFKQKDQQKPPLPIELVKDFVIAGHGNFDKTKQLLEQEPALLYATYDWGNGDFETALEGAGHTGNKTIANYLIEKGARTNLFVLTMLGKTQIVRSFLETFPLYLTARGPHGLTLLHHAQKGGEDSKELLDYIQSKGLKEASMKL
jgi:hypothetical protein